MAVNINILSTLDDKSLKQAQRELDKLGEQSKTFGQKLTGNLGAAGAAFASFGKKIALAGIAAGAGAVALGKKLVEAGENASTSNARIQQINESMGLFGDQAAQVTSRLVALAEQTARNTGIDQNAIKATQAKLLTFKEIAATAGDVGGQFDRATQAAIDLAAAGFGSAESNAVQLGKALNDPITGLTALTRSGVTFTEAEKARIAQLVESNQIGEAQALILQAIEAQVGGTAAATANASDKMRVAFSQLQERLGQKLLPVFEKVGTFIADKLLPAAERLAQQGMAELRNVFERLRPTLQAVSDIFRDRVQPVLERIGQWMAENTDVVRVFFAVLAGLATIAAIAGVASSLAALLNPVGLVIAAIAAIAAGLYFAYTRFETFRNIVDTVVDAIGWVFSNVLQPIFAKMVDGIKIYIDLVSKYIRFIIEVVRTVVNAVKPIIGTLVNIFKAVWEGIAWSIDNIFKPVFNGITSFIQGVINVGKPIVEAYIAIYTGIASAVKGAFQAAFNAVKSGWNAVAGFWNRSIGKFSFTIPSWVPGFGGSTFNMPDMPTLYRGGPVPGMAGTPVPIMAHGGEFVLSADVVEAIKRGAPTRGLTSPAYFSGDSGGAMGGGVPQVINVTVTSADPNAVVEALRRYNRTNGPLPVRVAG